MALDEGGERVKVGPLGEAEGRVEGEFGAYNLRK